jgi:hypothetical protein
MLNNLAGRQAPSMIVALLALFLSLGGVSYGVATGSIGSRDIKDNTVRGKDVRDRSLSGKDVKDNSLGGGQVNEGKLGQVPSAASADSATSAQDAHTLAGSPATAYARAGAEAVHAIGAPGEIAFNTGWRFGGIAGTEEVPGYWKDPAGTVHLRGAAGRSAGSGRVIFTLPVGYRPNLVQLYITYGGASTQAYVSVNPDGSVVWEGGSDENGSTDNSAYVGLGNITFRADR